MKIIFMGSADFGIKTFDALVNAGHEIAAVVTTPPAPKGRGRKLAPSPIAQHAQQRGIGPVLMPEKLKDPDLPAALRRYDADIFVVVAFRILPEAVFSIPPLGTFNIHASLLPRFRGPAPIQRAIQEGEAETGITIFRIDTGIDTGAVITRRAIPIAAEETTLELYERLATLGAQALVEVLPAVHDGTATYEVQDNTEASPAPKLRKEEGLVDWKRSSGEIFNQIRAFKPFPGTYTRFSGKNLHIEWARPTEPDISREPGTVCQITNDGFSVCCGEGALEIQRLRPEGSRSMEAGAFVRGYHLEEGQKLG